MSQDSHSFRRFLAYTLRYKGLLLLTVLVGLTKFGLNYTFPWLTGAALDKVIHPVDAGQTIASRTHWLWLLTFLGIFFALVHAISTYYRGFLAAKLGNRVIADLRQDLFDHLHSLSLHFYAKERTGSIVSRIINDIQTASQLINGGIVSTVMDLFSIFAGIGLLIHINWKMTLATLSVMPLYALTFKILNPRVRRASMRVQSQISKISGNVQERLAGISLVKTYAAEERESLAFHEDTEEHYDRVLAQSNLSQLISAISEGLTNGGQVLVIGVGGFLSMRALDQGGITSGQVINVIGILGVMYLPVRRFAEVNIVYQTSLAAIQRVFDVFDITPKIVEKPNAVTIVPHRGEVRFENVSFSYEDESAESQSTLEEPSSPEVIELRALERREPPPRRWVLKDINFTVEAGQRVALVGPSGSGKSTLVSLLPRLYDVSGGKLIIDGVNVTDYTLKALRSGIGIVQQDSFLFSGSVRQNIAYGRPDASEAEVIDAAKAANAHEFISQLPDGYDARLGERGVNLSGGQRQRMSIARAILKDPRILILDEATSALDSHSEAVVQEALARLMENRTCVIIAHRLSTVRDVDRILVLEAGRIVEAGKHDELVSREGLYARLVRQQFGPNAVLRAG